VPLLSKVGAFGGATFTFSEEGSLSLCTLLISLGAWMRKGVVGMVGEPLIDRA